MSPLHYAGSIAEQGVPVNGTRVVTVNLWNDATAATLANQLCTSTDANASVVQGRFVVALDPSCTPKVQTTTDSWAEVVVGGVSFGRQKVGASPYALISGAVNGVVKSDAILPNYGANSTLVTGAGGASVYNDGTASKALVITGNNSANALLHSIVLNDTVTVSGAETVNGLLNAPGGIALANSAIGGGRFTPAWTSPWTAVSNITGDVPFTHNLNFIPSQITLLTCGALDAALNCTTRVVHGVNGYHDGGSQINPLTTTTDPNTVYVSIYSGWWVWGYYTGGAFSCPGDADNNCFTGFYRVLIYR